MLKDITIGQFFPGNSIIHRLDPRFKIIITLIYIIMLFSGGNYLCLAVGALFTFGAILLSRIPLKMFWKSVKPLLPFLIITAILNLLLMNSGEVLWKWKFLKITEDGLNTSLFMVIRIVLLIMGTSLLTYTTSPITLTDAIERLLSPLRKVKFPVHELAMMMSIALRFIPTLIEETDKIMSAQKARGAEIDTGRDKISNSGREINVLNLFAYTGGATLACAAAGASVCHVDASKGMVQWARDNASASGLTEKPIRWIVDDCEKFIAREIRRGRKYDAIIMDPPSYGRGPGGEVWKLENCVYDLVKLCSGVLSDEPLFFLINSYTTGLSPSVMGYILGSVLTEKFGGMVSFDEIGLPVKTTGMTLPCGSTAIWEK